MENYDEDLSENSFFQVLQSSDVNLCSKASSNNWLVCVPRSSSLQNYKFSENDLETHILRPIDGECYKTLNNKSAVISGNVITTGAGFSQLSTIHILFDETFYLSGSESFKVICIEFPLDGGAIPSHNLDQFKQLNSLKDCIDFIWTETGGHKVTYQIDKLITSFNPKFNSSEGETIQMYKDVVHSLYANAMQILLKDPQVRKKEYLIDNFKLAVETIILHGVYEMLIKGLSSCMGYQDSKMNKHLRNLVDLQLKDLKVRPEFFQSIPNARREITKLQSFTTPLGKINCLKKTVLAISSNLSLNFKTGEKILLTTDDLLPIFIFLIIKSNIPNWLAHLTFMKSFRFSSSITYDNDEYGFYLTSLEAAIEHVKSGALLSSSNPEFMIGYSRIPIIERFGSDADNDGSNVIHKFFEAVRSGQEKEVNKYLDEEPQEQAQNTQILCHPLCSCDKCEQYLHCGLWLSKPTVNTRDERGYTALHLAAIYGHTPVLEVLLERVVNIDETDYRGFTALHLSSLRGHHNAALLLLHFHADWTLVDNDGNTPLHLASVNGHKDVVNALLYYTSQKIHPMMLCVNAGNDNGDTPLHLASKWGYVNIIKILIEHGAVIELENRRKMTPLDCAHNLHIKKILLKAIEMEYERQNNGFIPVSPISKDEKSQIEIVQDSDYNLESSPFILPNENGEMEKLSEKIDKLLVAVSNGDVNLTRFFLGWDQVYESDSDSEETTISKSTVESNMCHPLCQCEKCLPLAKMWTVNESPEINVNSANSGGFTPLHIAAMQGWTNLVSLFLKNGAIVNSVTILNQMTPIHFACQNNQVQVVKLLIENDAEVNVRDVFENTPLHYCCIKCHVQCARILLENSAIVNVLNTRGNTPLHEASRRNCENLVHLLLKYEAGRNILNYRNLLPFQIAQNKEMRQILMPINYGKESSLVVSSRHPMVEYHNLGTSGEEKVKMLSFGHPYIAPGEILKTTY